MKKLIDDDTLFYVWLTKINGLGPVLSRRLLNQYKSPDIIYNLNETELMKVEGIGCKLAKNIISSKDLEVAKDIIQSCIEKNIKITTLNDNIYPETINKYKDSPILLYYKGKLTKDIRGVGIVGSRKCSEYGKKIAIEAASYLASKGISVISGMAKGIDGYAHTACLKQNGYTVAVLASGADICYPREHINLYKKIQRNGVVISEYQPGTVATRINLIKRNKLISYFSEKLLIVEAGEKSGSLTTAKYVKKQNKIIFAPPNNKYLPESKGTNELIRDGATIYIEPCQLMIDGYNTKEKLFDIEKGNTINDYNGVEDKIIKLLKNNCLSIDEIIVLLKADKEEIVNAMLNLEIEGLLHMVSGGRYSA